MNRAISTALSGHALDEVSARSRGEGVDSHVAEHEDESRAESRIMSEPKTSVALATVEFVDQGIVRKLARVFSTLLRAAMRPRLRLRRRLCLLQCHVYVKPAQTSWSEAEEDEEDILDKTFDVRMESHRLGCRARDLRPGRLRVVITRRELGSLQERASRQRVEQGRGAG